ncbi:MAG: 50S ribosomal protein L14 [Methanobacteriota archaeon]|jgi:large subunit ribosomal protein L14|nr:MAG: 50S ribosomal protein L14 [Euryarchaeota archaeon]
MRAVAGRQMRGLPQGARLNCVDNSGAKLIEIVTVLNYKGVHRRSPAAGVGDMIVASVKKGNPEMRRQLVRAVVVRSRRAFRRADGTMVQFEDNAAVLTNELGETKGSSIKGPVCREAAERWPRIAAAATTIV